MLAPQRQQFHSIRVPYLLSLIAKAINFKEIIISKDSNLKLKVQNLCKKMNISNNVKDQIKFLSKSMQIHPWTLVIYQGLIYLLIEVKLVASTELPGHFLSTNFRQQVTWVLLFNFCSHGLLDSQYF